MKQNYGAREPPCANNSIHPQQSEFTFDASKSLYQDSAYLERRRGSCVESRSEADRRFFKDAEEIQVRTPRRGRRRSIVVPGTTGAVKNFPIGRLNNYDPLMKMRRGPVSLDSDLESIEENSDDLNDGTNSDKKLVFNQEYVREENK